ncbi:alpha/beta fold hydrolase [Acuticoccus sp.]|uniref:alpha/beta fold hydrolase n=1 Tax=Acuticoccus sp. TaxID=1904378 RepID=UPI003B53042E
MNDDAMMHAAALLAAKDDHDPADVLGAFEGAAERFMTPCSEGTMLWHAFGDGPPLALFHGGHGSWLHFLPMIPALAAHRRLLLPDLPGFGGSADPPTMPDEGVGLADAVSQPVEEGLLQIVGDTAPLAIGGFSFGAVVASRIAARLGERVSHLVLIGAPGLGLAIAERPPLHKVRGVDAASLEAVHRANLAALMIADPANIDRLAVRIQATNVPRARTPSRLASRTTALRDALPNVAARVVAIYGERDVVAPQHDEREALIASLAPGARQHVLPGIGHWAPYEAPDDVAQLILEELGAPAPARADPPL